MLTLLYALIFIASANARPQETLPATERAVTTRAFLNQLKWTGASGHEEYLLLRDRTTELLLKEADRFVMDSFRPETATTEQIRAGLNSLLGYTEKGTLVCDSNTAFMLRLAKGYFLVVGVELLRGGPVIPEDAISFRAYKSAKDRFEFISSTEDLHSSNPENPFLIRLRMTPLRVAPIAGEFWFLASAEVPPQSPPTVAVRLYAFDGERFRTVWAPRDVLAEGAGSVTDLTGNGFVLNSLLDPTDHAAHSPTVVLHERYAVGPRGPDKISEWRTERQ